MAQPVFAQGEVAEAPTEKAANSDKDKGGIQNWRYSEFMTAVEEDNVEKATFSADGKRVLVVDTDGNRYKLDALPNDPTLLDTLSKHKVDVTVLPAQQAASGGQSLLSSLAFPALLFGGLSFCRSADKMAVEACPAAWVDPATPCRWARRRPRFRCSRTLV